jgi:hypothetical protein
LMSWTVFATGILEGHREKTVGGDKDYNIDHAVIDLNIYRNEINLGNNVIHHWIYYTLSVHILTVHWWVAKKQFWERTGEKNWERSSYQYNADNYWDHKSL